MKARKFVPFYNLKAIENIPSEIDCPKCNKTGWIAEVKCEHCDGYGILNLSLAQRTSISHGDCYINKEQGTLTYYQ